MAVVVKRFEETNLTLRQIHDLIIVSFRDRIDNGLNFSLATSTFEQFEQYVLNNDSHMFVAIDEESGILVGTSTLIIRRRQNCIYGHHGLWAIDPDYQGRGLGRALLDKEIDLARSLQLSYIESDTAVKAESSVRAHLKGGFRKCGYASFKFTNYYSFLFRLSTTRSVVKNCIRHHIVYPICYLVSYILISLLKNEDGSYTLLGNIARKTRGY